MKIQLEKRNPTKKGTLGTIIGGIVAVLVCLMGVFLAVGVDPLGGIALLFTGGFASFYDLSEVLVKTSPLILSSLAVAVCLKMKLWNIGGQGQMYMGAVGAIWMTRLLPGLPTALMLPMVMIGAMILGGLLALLVGFLKEKLGVSEILSSLMLNYIVVYFVDFLVYGPWQAPQKYGTTEQMVKTAWFPRLEGTRLHLGVLIAVIVAVIVWLVLEKTKWGFEVRMTGASSGAAQYAGVSIGKNMLLVFFLSGALAGLAGMGEMSGVYRKLQESNISANYGNLGIIIAWLANANPLVAVGISFLGGLLLIGSDCVQVQMGVTTDMIQVIIALVMLGTVTCQFFLRNRLVLIKGKKERVL